MCETDTPTALSEKAAQWALRVDAGDLTPAEDAALKIWTELDPRHAGAFARALAANAYFDRVAAMQPRLRTLDEHAEGADAPATGTGAGLTRRAWLGGGIGALAATLVAAIGVTRWRGGERIAAPLGSVRRAALDDGSAVTLNTNAEIAVALETSVRRVRLISGEVNFDVAKDRLRPFLIDAGRVEIEVVGTSFLVRRSADDSVVVTVREGIVAVRRDGGVPIRLVAGDRLILTASMPARRDTLSMADVDRISLWQRGEIDLTGMTLGEAATEFARYSDRHILIPDPQVARLKVAGIYSTSDPVGFADAAALAQGLTIRDAPGGIVLSR